MGVLRGFSAWSITLCSTVRTATSSSFESLAPIADNDRRMSYSKTLKTPQFESVDMTLRKHYLLFAGALQRANPERLSRRVIFGTMAGGETRDQVTRKNMGPMPGKRHRGV